MIADSDRSGLVPAIDVSRRGWRHDEFLVSSFEHERLEETRCLLPELRLGALIARKPRGLAAFAERLGAWSLHASKSCVSEKLVADAHQRGLKVFVFTVNTPKEIARCETLGVDGVFSDFPERVAGALRGLVI